FSFAPGGPARQPGDHHRVPRPPRPYGPPVKGLGRPVVALAGGAAGSSHRRCATAPGHHERGRALEAPGSAAASPLPAGTAHALVCTRLPLPGSPVTLPRSEAHPT